MDKVGAAPTQDVAVHLEMFATTHPLELAQGTTRVVSYRELAPNNTIVWRIHLDCTCRSLLPHYQATLYFATIFTAHLRVYTCMTG